MTPKRAKYLQEWSHDQQIRMHQANLDGKVIPHLSEIAQFYKILEDLLEHVRQDLGSG